ncbi:uncharacterized protein Z518_05981 [Rhinocladiella mackenziei CBS 650.93]|uniref:Heterokaryon incompatibility domain-containing protein n=1 Tax=Rhinocladiella mackenziei CBS 650.93 TaxID=1442369 RepID=A0A0D2IH69_9EURO|nr:uncharacterized protein Z518_05981 [Rhinocladiella mackenziei CBS 650.93]KIX05109.1 hypothetical protein Z518_05981 [Rhinocladiella mackenziei CBS 650.93]
MDGYTSGLILSTFDPANDNETANGIEHDIFESHIERLMNWDSHIYYWIDALCINQWDEEEKAEQVNLMGSIYEAAEVVILWLGKADKCTSDVIGMIDRLAKVHDEGCETRYDLQSPTALDTLLNPEQRRHLGFQRFTLQNWVDLILFFERTWFTRAWTLQEVALAQCAAFGVRSHSASLMMELTPLAPMLKFLSLQLNIKRTKALSHARLAMLMRDLAFGNADESEPSGVFNPCDQIFACLGIVRKAAANVKGAPLGIIPNYRKPIMDVYTEAMTYILTGTGTLSPLSRVQHSAESKGIGLPSWVADMSAARSTRLRISKGFIISGYTLTVHLYRHAAVTHVGDSRDEMCESNTLDKTAQLALARSELTSAQGLLIDDVWKTMLCDVLSPRHRRYSDNDLRSGLTWFLKCMCYGLSSQVSGPNHANDIRSRTKWLELLAERDDTGTILSPKAVIASFRESDRERGSQRAEALIFEQLFDRSMSGRRLFLLDTGEIGVGSDDIQLGDTLCIIADGARTPFVLRKASSATINTWTLVGESIRTWDHVWRGS